MNLIKNAIYNIIYQLFNILIPIITVPYISRVLGKTGVGDYSYSNSYVQYFITFGMIGISLYGSRQIAYNRNNKNKLSDDFWNIYSLQFITTSVSTIIYLIIFTLINKENTYLYLAQGINLLASIIDISWFFIGYEEMKKVVLRNLVSKVIGIILIFIFVKSKSDIILYTVILATSMLIGQLIMWISLKDKIIIVRPNLNKIKRHFLPASSLFITQLAAQIYVLIDKTMLGVITNNAEVGIYENSQKTIKLALTVATSIGIVVMPRMSSLYSSGQMKKFKEILHKSLNFISLLAFPTCLGLIAISSSFSPWFYGEEFIGIENIIKIGSIIIIPISISNVLGMQTLIPIGRENKFTLSVIGGLFINIIFNIMLIKNYGALGATISSVFGEFTITLIQIYFLKDIISVKNILKATIKPLVGSAIMCYFVVILVNNMNINIVNTIIQVIVGGAIYLLIMIILKNECLNDIFIRLKLKK